MEDETKLNEIFATLDRIGEASREIEKTDCYPRESFWTDFLNKLSPEMKVALAFQLLGNCIDCETGRLTRKGKHFAIDLGYEAGPDYLQGFYHFGCAVSNAEK